MYQQKGRRTNFSEVPLSKVKSIIKEARGIQFPWDAIPEPTQSWLQAMAGAINTQPEFILLGALTVTSCLMGPECKVQIRSRHAEPCNIFTACLCEPGTGKTQAYKVAVETPLQYIPSKILVHDYTSKGLFEHLKTREGRALICHAEMTSFYENLMRRQYEGNGERQMFCRFHDGNSLFIRTSHGRASKQTGSNTHSRPQDEREELESSCLALGGFCQPQPYVNLHQTLGLSDDGFLDRISTCIVDSNILREAEVELWNETLDSYNIAEFNDVYKSIYSIHGEPRIYTFTPEAKVLYQKFADEIVNQMNRQLQEDVIVEDNMSKDRKIFLRLCAVIHVLFTVLNYYLKEEVRQDECIFIPLEIGIETTRTVEQIVNYFASQRQVINKVKKTQPKDAQTATSNCNNETEPEETTADKIFNQLGNLILGACTGRTSQQIFMFVRKTVYGYNEAIAIRWQEIPNETAGEENEAVKNKHQDELKNEWFAKMSHHSDKCIKSVTREMMQKDGSWKGVRCSVVQFCAFNEEMSTSLKQAIPDIDPEVPARQSQAESTISRNTTHNVPSPNVTDTEVLDPDVTDISSNVTQNAADVQEIATVVAANPLDITEIAVDVRQNVPNSALDVTAIVPDVTEIASVKSATVKKRAVSTLEDSLSKNEKVSGKRVRNRR